MPLYAGQTTIFKRRLGERYADYIRRGHAAIRVNSVECEPMSPKMEDGSVKNFELETSAGRIPAQIGLLERRSIVGSYGIDLYHRNRLIKLHSRFGIRSHPNLARVVGRVSLDHVPVNFYKTGFNVESAEYAEAERAFRDHPVVKETLRAQSYRRGAAADAGAGIYDYLLGKAPEPVPVDLRVGRSASRRLLDALRPAKFNIEGRTVRVAYADAGGAPYAIDGRGSALAVTVNKKSRLFSAVANPLYLVALAMAEARALCTTGADMERFLGERSRLWTQAMEGWIPEDRGAAARRRPELDGYRLSRRLERLDAYLAGRYEFVYEFSGLSTLEEYTHNVIGTPVYSLHTVKGQGGYLRDLVMEHDAALVPIVNPRGDNIEALLDAGRGRPHVAIREYSKSGLRQGLARPAKAWMDLLREAHYHRMPVFQGGSGGDPPAAQGAGPGQALRSGGDS